jgi:SHS2 domain-containing protein
VPFRELSHTGDVQYEVTGPTLSAVLTESIRALVATITEPARLTPREERRTEASGETLPDLLVNVLRACLAEFSHGAFLPAESRVEVSEGPPFHASLILRGEQFREGHHPYRTEVKAVTYHGASLAQTPQG